MSTQYGHWNFAGEVMHRSELQAVADVLGPYAPDHTSVHADNGVNLVYRAFVVTEDCNGEQVHRAHDGSLLMFDGRLDNRQELIIELGQGLSADSTDGQIVTQAYNQRGTDCFLRLLGDWAISVVNASRRTVTLAKDFLGLRPLFYHISKEDVSWCTVLEPIVASLKGQLSLSDEYLVGWLTFFPASHLTPYREIRSVPAGSFVVITPDAHKIQKYWELVPYKLPATLSDGEYEEAFRAALGESVRRRLRSDGKVLAELSGGMDSSSIVCMADTLVVRGDSSANVDTVSFFCDSEPNWDERPYFTRVEEQRGRVGFHVDMGHESILSFTDASFGLLPPMSSDSNVSKLLRSHISSENYRVVLSGIGGDEVLGGVPTPVPELQDLIATCRLRRLCHQLKLWALNKRKPWFFILGEAIREFLPAELRRGGNPLMVPSWLRPDCRRKYKSELQDSRINLFDALPSVQQLRLGIEHLRRQVSCELPSRDPAYERRYPYLDRTFLEFVASVPRDQWLRPGHRRSLMRRALIGIVPAEILDRKRKAYVVRGPRVALQEHSQLVNQLTQGMAASAIKVVDEQSLRKDVAAIAENADLNIVALMRALYWEIWARYVTCRGLVFQDTKLLPFKYETVFDLS